MSKCPSCGEPIDAGQRVCPHCGYTKQMGEGSRFALQCFSVLILVVFGLPAALIGGCAVIFLPQSRGQDIALILLFAVGGLGLFGLLVWAVVAAWKR